MTSQVCDHDVMRLCHENQRPDIGGWAARVTTNPGVWPLPSLTQGVICLPERRDVTGCHSGCGTWWPGDLVTTDWGQGSEGSYVTVRFLERRGFVLHTPSWTSVWYRVMHGVCDADGPGPLSDPRPIFGVRLKCLQNLVLMPIYCITARIIWPGYLKCAQSEPWQHFTTTIFTLTIHTTLHIALSEEMCSCVSVLFTIVTKTWHYLYHPNEGEPSWEELSCQSNCNYHCFCQFLFWLF